MHQAFLAQKRELWTRVPGFLFPEFKDSLSPKHPSDAAQDGPDISVGPHAGDGAFFELSSLLWRSSVRWVLHSISHIQEGHRVVSRDFIKAPTKALL